MTSRPLRIYYFGYRHNQPRGGQKRTYQDVDTLNANGFDAVVFHPGTDFRLTWFENQTSVIEYSEFVERVDSSRDFVVLPEDLGDSILEFPGRKVIYNKNTFKGFECFGRLERKRYPYDSPTVVAAMTVSEHNRRMLQFAYPHLLVENVTVGIDPNIFSFCPLEEKAPLIACTPKSTEMLLPIYHMIQSRANAGLNRGRNFRWVFLEKHSERETARILREAYVFVFLSVAEGIGRMPLEAMASGCILLAYDYGPLYGAIPGAWSFEYGDLISIVRVIEELMEGYPGGGKSWVLQVEQGRETAARYTRATQERAVVTAWQRIIAAAPTPDTHG